MLHEVSVNVHRFPDRDQWLRQRVYERYVGQRPVMGAPDDTDDGHNAALASAKLSVIRELVLEERRTRFEHGLLESILVDDILTVLEAS